MPTSFGGHLDSNARPVPRSKARRVLLFITTTGLAASLIGLVCTQVQSTGWIWSATLRARELAASVRNLNNTLDLSAQLAAATGDPAWIEEFRRREPELNAALREMVTLAPDRQSAESGRAAEEASLMRVVSQQEALGSVRNGDRTRAAAALESAEFGAHQRKFQDALDEYQAALETALAEKRAACVSATTLNAGAALLCASLLVFVCLGIGVGDRVFDRETSARTRLFRNANDRWSLAYYGLAAITTGSIVAAFMAATYSQNRLNGMISSFRHWSEVDERLALLDSALSAAGSPGRRIFSTHDALHAREGLQQAANNFAVRLDALRESIRSAFDAQHLVGFLPQLDRVAAGAAEVRELAEETIDRIESGNLESATRAMARMDNSVEKTRDLLTGATAYLRDVRRDAGDREAEDARTTRVIRTVLCGLFLAAIAGLVYYGRHMARVRSASEFERAARLRELERTRADLEARTAELETANAVALAASRGKSAFLANMSHEIRTPINGIVGALSLLRRTALQPDQERYTNIARQSSETLLHLVNDILDLSRIEAGGLELEQVPFDLRDCVAGSAEIVAFRAAEKNLELVCDIDPSVPQRISGDPTRLGQILLNLMNNAVKFTSAGSVVTRIRSERSDGRAALLRFEVADTGIGIPADRRDRLFKAFSQVDASMTRRYGGTGLGLAICARLVESMGGALGVESIEGEGSTFWFTLPVAVAPDLAANERSIGNLRRLRVLVVDDSPPSRSAIGSLLRTWGVGHELADSGDAGLARLRRAAQEGAPFDLVLIDHHMPGRDGLSTAEMIQAAPGCSATRLILLSAKLSELSDAQQQAAGFAAALSKPVSASTLHDTISDVFAPAERRRKSSRPTDNPAFRGVSVLLVEDNEVNRMITRELLAQWGIDVVEAVNGQQALERINARRFDVVLMDCQMPLMDGMEATRRVRVAEKAAGGPHLPIVALTANAFSSDRDECLAAGMDDYLAKPIDPSALSATLARWLRMQTSTPVAAPTPPPPASTDLFSQDDLLARCGGQVAVAHSILGRFLDSAPDLIGRIETASGANVLPEAARAAHQLCGTAATIGCRALSAVAREAEQAARAGDQELLAAAIRRLSQTFSQTAAQVRAALSSQTTRESP